jgi:hypothetical protein
MKRLFTLVCLCGFLAAMVGSVDAQEKPEKKAPDKAAQFAKLDTTGPEQKPDGKLSLAEFKAGKKGKALENADKAFARLDADKDGSVTLKEFTAPPKKKKPE